jgi:hypothetical protein
MRMLTGVWVRLVVMVMVAATMSVSAQQQEQVVNPYVTDWSGVRWTPPVREIICATVQASSFGFGRYSAKAGIQAALDACPEGQVVQLGPGRFQVPDTLLMRKNVTLRGSGPGVTHLEKSNSNTTNDPALPLESEPIILIGSTKFANTDDSTSVALTEDGLQGSRSITVADATGITAGQFVKIDADEWTTAGWLPDAPLKNGTPMEIWGTDRITFRKRQPLQPGQADVGDGTMNDYSRYGRVVNEIKEVESVVGNVVTFTSPLHIAYPVSKASQLVRYTGANVHIRGVQVEDLTLEGGTDGNILVTTAAYSGVRNVECAHYGNPCVDMKNGVFRFQIRDSNIHHTNIPVPGGGGYALSARGGASEILIENNIIVYANKLMAFRASGAGSVVGYNYTANSLISYDMQFTEVGLNGSHFPGPHHILFEGNESHNYDSDFTFGSSIYMTILRNNLLGERRSYPLTGQGGRAARAAGLGAQSWWHAFIGNVLGKPGLDPTKWIYEDLCDGTMTTNDVACAWKYAIWRLGYSGIGSQLGSTLTRERAIRQGNFDYLTNSVRWDTSPAAIPNSYYLTAKPEFFGDMPWPWVDPTGAVKTHTLPAKLRYECLINTADCRSATDYSAAVRTELTAMTAERDAAATARDAAVVERDAAVAAKSLLEVKIDTLLTRLKEILATWSAIIP